MLVVPTALAIYSPQCSVVADADFAGRFIVVLSNLQLLAQLDKNSKKKVLVLGC